MTEGLQTGWCGQHKKKPKEKKKVKKMHKNQNDINFS